MKHYDPKILLIFIAILFIICPQADAQEQVYPYPGQTYDYYDHYVKYKDTSGPGRTTLFAQPWGTVFYEEAEMSGVTITSNLGRYTIKTPTETIYVRLENNKTIVEYPDFKISVSNWYNRKVVEFNNREYSFKTLYDKLLIDTPFDQIKYEWLTHRLSTLEVTGNKGIMRFIRDINGYTFEGPQGNTTIAKKNLSQQIYEGIPLSHQPYLYRGFIFQKGKVGIFIDFLKLFQFKGMEQFIDWQNIMIFRQDG